VTTKKKKENMEKSPGKPGKKSRRGAQPHLKVTKCRTPLGGVENRERIKGAETEWKKKKGLTKPKPAPLLTPHATKGKENLTKKPKKKKKWYNTYKQAGEGGGTGFLSGGAKGFVGGTRKTKSQKSIKRPEGPYLLAVLKCNSREKTPK